MSASETENILASAFPVHPIYGFGATNLSNKCVACEDSDSKSQNRMAIGKRLSLVVFMFADHVVDTAFYVDVDYVAIIACQSPVFHSQPSYDCSCVCACSCKRK